MQLEINKELQTIRETITAVKSHVIVDYLNKDTRIFRYFSIN